MIIDDLILSKNWQQMATHLKRLSNMEFRRTETHIRTCLLPTLCNADFWDALLHLIIYKRQAFLSGILTVGLLEGDGRLDLDATEALAFFEHIRTHEPESVTKIVNMALEQLNHTDNIERILTLCHIDDERQRISHLLKIDSLPAYYKLFQALKHTADNHELARRSCLYIMKRRNDRAFNMASLLQAYFGIDELRSLFSLRIEPYELNLIDRDYDTFTHVLNGKRPKI